MFSSRSKTSSAVTMTPERQWIPLEGHRPPPWTATTLPAVRSTSCAVLSENATRGLLGSTMSISPRRQCMVRYGITADLLLLAKWLGCMFAKEGATHRWRELMLQSAKPDGPLRQRYPALDCVLAYSNSLFMYALSN